LELSPDTAFRLDLLLLADTQHGTAFAGRSRYNPAYRFAEPEDVRCHGRLLC
jgi:hypothetical protein